MPNFGAPGGIRIYETAARITRFDRIFVSFLPDFKWPVKRKNTVFPDPARARGCLPKTGPGTGPVLRVQLRVFPISRNGLLR